MKVVYIDRNVYANLLEGNLPDIKLIPLNDIDTKLESFHKYYLKVTLKRAPDQDLTNFHSKEAAKKGIIVITIFDLEREAVDIELLKEENIKSFDKKNRDLNCIKMIIEPVKSQKAASEIKVKQSLYGQETLPDVKEAFMGMMVCSQEATEEHQGLID